MRTLATTTVLRPITTRSEGEQENRDGCERQGGSDSDLPDALDFLFAVDRLRLGDSFCFPSSHIVFPFRDPGPLRNRVEPTP